MPRGKWPATTIRRAAAQRQGQDAAAARTSAAAEAVSGGFVAKFAQTRLGASANPLGGSLTCHSPLTIRPTLDPTARAVLSLAKSTVES